MGDARKDRQKTKHAQSWGQIDWALVRRHTSPLHLSEFIIYSSHRRRKGISLGRECDIVILGNRRNL
jgi:hypothetical protein